MPGIADVVSANTRAGSRPETKVSVQTTLATKPVATFGTSRARAAESASALSAAVLARMRMRFRRFTVASGMTHQRVPAMMAKRIHAGSPDLEIALAETWKRLADSEIMQELQCYKIRPPSP